MWGGTKRQEDIEAIRSSYSLGLTSIDAALLTDRGLVKKLLGKRSKAYPMLMKQGKVRCAGVCNYDAGQMIAEKAIKLAFNQVPYSMVKRSIEKELIPYCVKNEKSILAYNTLERGLLTGKMKPGHEFANGDHRQNLSFFKDVNLKCTNELLDKIKPIADQKHLTLGQLVIFMDS